MSEPPRTPSPETRSAVSLGSIPSSPSLSPAASPIIVRRGGSSNNLHGLTDKTTVVSDGSTQWKKERRDAWDWKDTLGTGSYSEVFRVTDKQTGQDFAAKVMNKRELLKMRKVEAAFAEKAMLTDLKHAGIIGLFQTFQDPENLYFILELCPNGDLLDYVNKQPDGRLTEEVARFFLSEVVVALEFIHSKNIIYRDLKLENILLDENFHCKICDFNTAAKLNSPTDTVGSIAGTPEYVPPELIIDSKTGLSGDIWSLGCLTFQLLSGVSPFRAASEFLSFQQIRNRDFHWSDLLSPTARELIDKMLGVDWSAVYSSPAPAAVRAAVGTSDST